MAAAVLWTRARPGASPVSDDASLAPGVTASVMPDSLVRRRLDRASELNRKDIPTAQGGKQWYPQTVSNIVRA